MTTELQMLLWAMALGLVHLVATVLATIAQNGMMYAFKARDEQRPLVGTMARLERAFRNFLETFPFFIAAVLMAQALNHHTAMSVLGAQLYFWARLVYIPIYVSGLPVVRTLTWSVSMAGILMVMSAAI